MHMTRAPVLALLLLAGPALAQQSSSFQVTESSFSAGAEMLTSTAFQITLVSAGQGPAGTAVSGPSFSVEGGVVAALAPPGEVSDLRFTDEVTLQWAPDGSVGDYAVYRGIVTEPFDSDYGSCLPPAVTMESAMDAQEPLSGQTFFYLVTARNRLGEEGTKGFDGGANERGNTTPCP